MPRKVASLEQKARDASTTIYSILSKYDNDIVALKEMHNSYRKNKDSSLKQPYNDYLYYKQLERVIKKYNNDQVTTDSSRSRNHHPNDPSSQVPLSQHPPMTNPSRYPILDPSLEQKARDASTKINRILSKYDNDINRLKEMHNRY